MAIIYSYPFDQKVTDTDSWVGNDSVSRQTKQYTAQAVADYLNINGKVFVAGQMTYQLISDPSEKSGTFAFPLGDGDGTPWSNITSFVIADRDLSKQDVSPFLNYLVGEQIMFQDVSEKRSFGHYIMEGYTQIVGTNFYEMQLKYIGGNGVVTIDNYYTLVNFYLEIGDAKVETIEGLNTTYIDVAPSTPTTGDVQISASLSATDGTSTPLSRFLTKDNKWATVSVANETYTLPVSAGSANSAKIDLTAGGTGSGIKSTVEFKGTTNRISISEVVGNNGNITIDMPDDVTIVNDLTAGGELTILGTGASSIAGTLGIGLSNPNAKLNVDGIVKIEGTNPLAFGGTPSIPDFNIYSSSGDLIIDDVATNVNGNVLFTNGGNVGIGTTNPTTKLHVEGGITKLDSKSFTSNTLGLYSNFDNTAIVMFADDPIANSGMINISSSNTSGNNEIGMNFAVDGFSSTNVKLSLLNTGQLKAHSYGSGSFTGTATQRLAVDTSGNVIEIPIGSGPVDGSGTANYTARWIDTDTLGIGALYDNGTNVGIGTTSPSELLHVQGSNATIQTVESGGATVKMRSGSVGRFGTYSNNNLVFVSNSNDRMTINSSGNVGIGTTSPAQRLHVNSSVTNHIAVFESTDSVAEITIKDSSKYTRLLTVSADFKIIPNNGLQEFIFEGDTGNFLVTGNVGIGTTSPSSRLEIAGTGNQKLLVNRTDGDNFYIDAQNGQIRLRGSSDIYMGVGSDVLTVTNTVVGVGTTAPLGKLDVYSTTGLGIRVRSPQGTGIRVQGGSSTHNVAEFQNSVQNTVMVLNDVGKLGIGTTSPAYKLDVDGEIKSDGYRINLSGGTERAITSTGTDSIQFGDAGVNEFKFKNTAGTSMIINSSGNVGIGTTTPGERFEVQGGNVKFKSTTTHQRLYIQSPDDKQSIIYFGDQNSHSIGRIAYNNNGDYMYFNTNGGQRMTITSVGNVGIGTTSPAEQLHVNGDVRVDGTGGVATKKIRSSYFSSTQNLDLVAGSSADIILTSDKVGIGTSSPSEKLSVSGNTNITGKLAVGSTASHPSFDFYNQGTAYFNGSTTIDDDLTVTNGVTATTFSGDLDGTINTSTTAVTKPNATNDTTVATTAFVQNLIGTIPAGLVFQGTWDASTNTPTLSGGSGTTGHFYIVSTSGSTNLDGITDWKVGDWAVFVEQGATDAWEKVDNSSVLDGSGTGQKVSMWSGSGTSNTITDAPMTISGSNTTFAGDISLSDSKNAKFGNNDDLRIYHSGTNSNIENFTGNLQFVQNTDDGNITFLTDNGAGGTVEYMRIDGSGELVVFSKDVKLQDNDILRFGNANDLKMYHDASNSYISQQGTGHLYIENTQDDSDIIFRSDNGSGGVENYMQIDGSAGRTLFNKHIRVNDNVQIQVGSSADMQIYHNSIDSFIYNGAGDLVLENNANDKDIIFKSDNGSGGTTPYLKLWGAIESLAVYKDMLFVNDGNGGKLKFGASQDLQIYHDGSHSYIDNTTGDIRFQQFADNGKIRFYNDDGTGGTTEYFRLDGDSVKSVFSKPVQFLDNTRLMVGSSNDLEIYHDGSNSYIKDTGTGNLWIQGSSQVNIGGANGEIGIQYVENANVTLRHNNAAKLTTTSTGIDVTGEVKGDSLDIDGAADVSGNAVFHGKTGFGGATSAYNVHAIGTGWSATGVAIQSTTTNGAVLSLINTARTFQVASRNNCFDVRDMTAGDVRRFYIDSSGVSNFEGNVRLTSNSLSFVGRKFVARDGNGTGLFADDAASGLSIADNGNATFTGNVTLDGDGKLLKFTPTSYDDVELGIDSNGFVIYNTTDARYDLKINGDGNATFGGHLNTVDNKGIYVGTGLDFGMYHDGTHTYITNDSITGSNLYIRNATNDADTIFQGDDGSGGLASYFRLEGSEVRTGFLKKTIHYDNVQARFGDSSDLRIYHDGNTSYINQTGTGKLLLRSASGINIEAASGETRVTYYGVDSTLKVDDAAQANKIILRSNGNSYFNGGNVGIGVTNPNAPLVVQSSVETVSRFKSTDNKASINIADDDTSIYVSAENSRASFGFQVGTHSNNLNINSSGDVGIGTNTLDYKLNVGGGIVAGGVVTYSKSAGSLDTTGYAVAGITANANGNGFSCGFTFTCFGHTGGYQKIVYSCYNGAGTWYASKVIDEGTNDFNVEASANGSTITFTFKAVSSTKYNTPRVTVEATGHNINSTYA